uniref:Glycine cleavage system protein H n=1 Tax=Ignisphaera aggregans TaxID=334771 RepID=A0A7C5XI74_9CREN
MTKVDSFELKEELYYWPRNLSWAKIESSNRVRVGLSDVGAKAAGEIVFIRFRPIGTIVRQGQPIAVIESAKWVGPIESPVTGKIIEVNNELRKNPKMIMNDPYGSGWVAVIEPSNLDEDLKNLLKGSDPQTVEWYKEQIAKLIKR